MDTDIYWGVDNNRKRKYNDDDDGSNNNDNKKINRDKFKLVDDDDVHIYKVGNEIQFSSPITLESIQKIIKLIGEMVYEHQKINKSKELTISYTIDSPGGSVLSILKFVDFINGVKKKHPNIKFVSIITGLAASAGTIMALTADRRVMTKNAYAMVHELSSGNSGKYTFLASHMEFIDQLHDKLVNIYVESTGKSVEDIEAIMKKETWFSATQYKNMNFIHEII